MQEFVTLLGSASVLALLVALVTCALGLRRRATRRDLSWAEALSQWWAWLQTGLSAWSSAADSGSSASLYFRTSRVWRVFLALVWVAAVFLVPYQAQPVSAKHTAGYSEYYILGDEEDILVALGEVNPLGDTQGPIRSRVSIVAVADGTNVYLDEWENEYGFDPGDPYNTADAKWDIAPGGPGEEGPALNEGQVLTLSETDTFVPGSEGIDGGDRLYITGAPVSIVRIVWPDSPGPYLAGSWELYPLQAWQSSYVVPVGEDLAFPDSPDPFEYTFLFIEAAEDGTRVVVTDPTGIVLTDIVLGQGENIYLPDIEAGTTVSATGPIQAGLITSVNDIYDSRYYTLTPEEFLCDEYYLPVPSMQFPAGEFGGRDIDTVAYIYAFQDNTDINIENGAGTQTITLDAGEVYRYVMPRIPRGTIQGSYGARVTTDDPGHKIWILVAGDDDAPDLDWGYQAMCSSLLGREYYLPHAPANPAHVTPMDDDTTFFVDWDNDGVTDETFTLNRFDTRMLFDPDRDATGAHIYADGPFAIAWGQDNTEGTPGEGTPDFDYGYTILPLEPTTWLDPVLDIEKTVDPTSLPAEGGAVQFTLVVSTGDYPVYNVDISDSLPPGWRYINGTTTISFSDGTPAIYDDPAGAPGPNLLWELDHDLGPNQNIIVNFGAETIPGVYSAGLHDNLGQAYGTSTVDENDPNAAVFRPEDHAYVFIPILPALRLVKSSSAGGLVNPGDVITYTIVISNVGTAPATGVTVSDTLPANTTWADNVTIAPPSAGGTAGTPPIIASGMTVEAGSHVTVTFAVAVNTPLPAGVDTITNTACVNSTEIITPVCDTVTDRTPESLSPDIELAKTVYLGHDGGAGCPGSESATGASGADVTYCFEVTNTGNTHLDSITINDPDLGITEADMTLLSGFTPLAPGESLVYYYETVINGDLVNMASTRGNPTDAGGNDLLGLDDPTDDDTAAVAISLAPTPTPERGPEREPPEPEPPTPIPPIPVTPTPTVEVLTVARLPETGGFPGWFTVVLGVPILIGAAGLLHLALLGMGGRRGSGKGD
jgi:uncharacterized repeat protein (TIGR01451 family)